MSIRSTYFTGLLLIIFLFAVSIYLQYFDGFAPCPLCTLQRLAFGLLGIWFLFGCLLYSRFGGRLVINLLSFITACAGIGLAGRQIWLQHFPPANNECGVSLQYMLEVLPLNQVFQKILFEGSNECTQRGWVFLNLNMAEWSLLWFVIFLLMTTYLFFKENKPFR